ncbi:MAG: monovalent cation:proton antiporter-2 (CPA2) family protein, partial [Mariprofundales bacterium]|nr:monovalent cation:proton antiporter-2 (CPA2) family protein [Mariprofundales bacterium]
MVPIASRLGLGSVLGYLIGGTLIGPWVLQLVTDPKVILNISEFGVVLLLFLVGLELSPTKLWDLRQPIFGSGTMQLIGSAALLSVPLFTLTDFSWQGCVIGSFALALSSTAMALQIINEKGAMSTPAGHQGFSILLFQDLAVIPLMAMMPLLVTVSTGETESGSEGLRKAGEAFIAILALISVGHFALRPVLRFIAATGIHEIFVAFTLFLVIGIALLMEHVGLSMALGSFIAGILLADSEYRHALETVIEPFKGLLMGLFFIAVGMAIDFGLLQAHTVQVLLLVAALIIIKTGVLIAVGALNKLPRQQIALFAITLSQGGEFAFVLLAMAAGGSILSHEESHMLMLVVAISMVSTPLLVLLHDKLLLPRISTRPQQPDRCNIEHNENPVVIAGFGRFGEVVGRLLMANNIGVTLLDHDPNHIERSRDYGFKIFFGSATRLDLLRAAGLAHAKVLVVAVDSPKRANKIVRLVRQHFPHLTIVARARDMRNLFDLMDNRVEYAYRET